MGAGQTAMADTEGLSARLSRQLCLAGGSMELGHLGRSLGLNARQLERLVEVEEGRSLVLRPQGEDMKAAVYRSALRLCTQTNPKCAGECGQLHLCRFYLLGNCSRQKCKFYHSIHIPHNLSVLQKYNLESMSIEELRQLLLQNDPNLLPDICSHYNRGDGPHGSCTFKNKCNKLHICQHFLQGDCKFGQKCKRCHNLSDEENLKKLTKWGLDARLVPGLLDTYINAHTLQTGCDAPPQNVVKSPEKKATPGSSKAETPKNTEEICLYFIRNSCSFKDNQNKRSQITPCIMDFCLSVNQNSLNKGTMVINLDFDTMTFQSKKVKRLSTPSSVSKPPHFIFTTDWIWYWKDEQSKWIEYGTESDGHASSTLCSSDLENVYQSDETADVKFKAGKHEYLLSFTDMEQRNLHYGTKRRVCRRPVFVSAEDVKKKRSRTSDATKEDKSMPPHWNKGQTPDVGYKLVLLSQSSEEYGKIETMFRRTLRTIRIHSIERIQNLALWEVYQW
eukprot:XP_002942703.2 PREDICTED: poly [ADP-ribose] polymerase 12-like [Xenopus tropicalis]